MVMEPDDCGGSSGWEKAMIWFEQETRRDAEQIAVALWAKRDGVVTWQVVLLPSDLE